MDPVLYSKPKMKQMNNYSISRAARFQNKFENRRAKEK